jgi:hypothetical protein
MLYRRVAPFPGHWDYLKERPTALAFRPASHHLEAHHADCVSIRELLRNHEGFGYCSLDIAEILRECTGIRVVYRPGIDPSLVVIENVTEENRSRLVAIARGSKAPDRQKLRM